MRGGKSLPKPGIWVFINLAHPVSTEDALKHSKVKKDGFESLMTQTADSPDLSNRLRT